MKQILLPILSLLIFLPNVDARFWTNKDGKSFEGELVEVKDNAITIRRTSDRIKFTVNAADLSQGDQDYLKELEEKKMAEEEAEKEKPIDPKDKLPTSKNRFAKWLEGTEWSMTQITTASGLHVRRVRRFNPRGVMLSQLKTLSWSEGLEIITDKYSVLSKNSIQFGGLGWILVFDEKYETFTGKSADGKVTCEGTFVTRFK